MTIDFIKANNEELSEYLTTVEETPKEKLGGMQNPETMQQELHSSASSQSTNKATPHENYEHQVLGIVKSYCHHSFAELCRKPQPIRYLIQDYVQEGALHLDYGESGSGKSFVTLDQACCIACEEINDWMGFKVNHHVPVVILAGEGSKGLGKRCATWAFEHGVNPENVQIEVIEEVFNLDDDNDPEHSIENTIANIKAISSNTGLIVIDTLNRYISGDENKAVDVAKFVKACDRLREEFSCAIKIVHHVGNALENKGRPRGSSSLFAAMDIATLYAKSDDSIYVQQKKHKDGICRNQNKTLKLNLKQVTLSEEWNDENSRPSTSCVVELSPDSQHNQPYIPEKPTKKKLTPTQTHAQDTYLEAAKKFGRKIHDEEADIDLVAVKNEDWRKVFYEMTSAKSLDSLKTRFSKAKRVLHEQDKFISKRIIEGNEYYCLDLRTDDERINTAITVIASSLNKRE